ncbi:MAG TPA: carboxypeptidase-like regulatory domain-containing protein [Chryseolinea sp.]|nr:carboxypeptidase-like regulatory domain-containing protein [Chryseolinea sp.]
MNRCAVTLLLLSLAVSNGFGQVIYGTVTDQSRQAIPFVNLFINNSTTGTTTGQDGRYRLPVKPGSWEIVFSFLGYERQTISFTITHQDSIRFDITLRQSVRLLPTVTVASKKDRQWQKDLKIFKRVFLGYDWSEYCTIAEPWYIDLEWKRENRVNTLKAKSDRSIDVENGYLGYRIYYHLQDFQSSNRSDQFYGKVFFEQLRPKDNRQADDWSNNRQKTYRGSIRHLFTSMLSDRVAEEGFTVFNEETVTTGMTRQTMFRPQVSEYDRQTDQYRIIIDHPLIISYKTSSSRTLNSKVVAKNGYVDVTKDGLLVDPLSIVVNGTMGTERVGQLLPSDYFPEDNSSSSKPLGSSVIDVLDSIVSAVEASQHSQSPSLFIHTDRSMYFSGDRCWFQVYPINDPQTLESASIIYLDLIDSDGNIVNHEMIKNDNLRATGYLPLNSNLRSGGYVLRAYTKHMIDNGLYCLKDLSILSPSQISVSTPSRPREIELKFFPEGGTVVPGVMTQIGFSAMDDKGMAVDVKGKIYDASNNQIGQFESNKHGIGTFPIVIGQGQTFYAAVDGGKLFQLPSAKDHYALQINSLGQDEVLLKIHVADSTDKTVFLVAASRETVYYSRMLAITRSSTVLSIPRNTLPEGVVRIMLLDSRGAMRCERLIFNQRLSPLKIEHYMFPNEPKARDSIEVRLSFTNQDGQPVVGALSISVTDADIQGDSDAGYDLRSSALLDPVGQGIENPAWYFGSRMNSRSYQLDLAMMTQHFPQADIKEGVQHMALNADGISLKGILVSNGKPLPNTPFAIVVPNDKNRIAAIHHTDSLGGFVINGLSLPDSTTIGWMIMGKRGTITAADVKLSPEFIPSVPKEIIDRAIRNGETAKLQYHDLTSHGQLTRYQRTSMLDTVTIQSSRIQLQSIASGILVRPAKIDMNLPTVQYVSRYAGKLPIIKPIMTRDGDFIWPGVKLMVDGFERDKEDPILVLNSISIDRIQYLYVKGNAYNGYFISIGTRSTPMLNTEMMVTKMVRGYQVAHKFPHLRHSKNLSTIEDNRITLFWDPEVHIGPDGNATIRFYNNDFSKRLLINAEGIANGKPISLRRVIGVDNR